MRENNTELEFRHAWQTALHMNGTNNLTIKDGTITSNLWNERSRNCSYHEVQLLNDIQEDFILGVFNTFLSPRNSIGDRSRDEHLLLHTVALLHNVLLQDLGVGGLGNGEEEQGKYLRITKIHHFIEQFIQDNKVISSNEWGGNEDTWCSLHWMCRYNLWRPGRSCAKRAWPWSHWHFGMSRRADTVLRSKYTADKSR